MQQYQSAVLFNLISIMSFTCHFISLFFLLTRIRYGMNLSLCSLHLALLQFLLEGVIFWSFLTKSLCYLPKSFNILNMLKRLYSDLPITLAITFLAPVKTNKVILTNFATTFPYLSIFIYFSSFTLHLPLFHVRYVHVRSQLG